MNTEISMFLTCVEAIICLLYNLHDCTLKGHVEDKTEKSISFDDNAISMFMFNFAKHLQKLYNTYNSIF